MSGSDNDDLEKELLLAAVESDARACEVQRVSVIKKIENEMETDPEQEVNEAAPETVIKEPIVTTQSHETAPKKRKHDVIEEDCKKQTGYASVIETHYNKLEEKGLDERNKSRIVYMRNFHNWIKSMQINEYIVKIKDSKRHNVPIRVLDMCCGKGGDLLKWRKAGISHLICSDIAAVSLDQCKSRYETNKRNGSSYSIELIHADCTKVRLREKYADPSIKLDLVSCQFAFHYSFESLPQAECMIRNAAECLNPGGYFIGTIPDANELMSRRNKAGMNKFGNDVYKVSFECDTDRPPLFGARYNFHLDGVVHCPEFLVHFPTLTELAKKYGLKLVNKEKFYNTFERLKLEGRNLLSNMSSLETYPSDQSTVGTSPNDYTHAENFLKQNNEDRRMKIGTLSKSEWEVSSIYLSFAFEKVKNTWNVDGTPKFEF
ncbi:PREDICTED: mRNA cap guanine-N7 methyltransferase [Nicrophorus vespilloides]|uniref:mRNA cap guanine-N(7) methyltransferase n=1 Tax=Nicrophorus vespilloides TaxID=110193 RepID=A0ABM1MLJ9_NICVS|nr:PREDICTED: mRNA cap guanine-N7 methyltransferase [Nicrophorus vespilloides]